VSNWTERAEVHFSQNPPNRTDETDEKGFRQFLSVVVQITSEKTQGGFVGFVSSGRAPFRENAGGFVGSVSTDPLFFEKDEGSTTRRTTPAPPSSDRNRIHRPTARKAGKRAGSVSDPKTRTEGSSCDIAVPLGIAGSAVESQAGTLGTPISNPEVSR
jgi:hypothetical protein